MGELQLPPDWVKGEATCVFFRKKPLSVKYAWLMSKHNSAWLIFLYIPQGHRVDLNLSGKKYLCKLN